MFESDRLFILWGPAMNLKKRFDNIHMVAFLVCSTVPREVLEQINDLVDVAEELKNEGYYCPMR